MRMPDMKMPEYAIPLQRFDDSLCYPPFFASAEDAPQDWNFVNRNGVFTYAKVVFEAKSKNNKTHIKIKLGNHFGYCNAGVSVESGGEGSHSPAMAKCAEKNCTNEREAILKGISEVYNRCGSYLKKTPEFATFEIWAKSFNRPEPEQLSLF